MKPEVLAPAGDLETLRVALAAGADAIYCGLAEGFNARAKTAGIALADLPAVAREVHLANARIYITFNTLIHEDELDYAASLIAGIAKAGADAIIVQDWAAALCAKRICPDLALHASTQMTLSSPEAVKQAENFGFTRVVAPRELTAKELALYTKSTPLEVEAFVHGALCISWSGQCNASENLGQGSANRGTCSQPCRMPYRLWVDGQLRPMPDRAYLLSPRDQCLVDDADFEKLGIASLKIEGRLKSPAYVAATVQLWRKRIDGCSQPRDKTLAALAFSRNAHSGFFNKIDHFDLIPGYSPAHRGLFCGTVQRAQNRFVEFNRAPEAPKLVPGQGVVFEAAHPNEEIGGPLFGIQQKGNLIALDMGAMSKDFSKLQIGQRVYLTSDPEVQKLARRLPQPTQRLPIRLNVSGNSGQPLHIWAQSGDATIEIQSEMPLEPTESAGLSDELLRQKLGAFGGTPFELKSLDSTLAQGLHLPVSQLKSLRRQLVEALSTTIANTYTKPVQEADWIPELKSTPRQAPLELAVLCRSLEQLKTVLSLNIDGLQITPELDFADDRVFLDACSLLGQRTAIYATTRIHLVDEKPLAFYKPGLPIHGLLLRHLGGLEAARETGLEIHGDLSLNIQNRASAAFYLNSGLLTVEGPSLLNLPPDRQRLTLYRRPPLFHMRHCLFAQHLGQPHACGQACHKHRLELEDHQNSRHGLMPGAYCRNTIFRQTPDRIDPKNARLQGLNRFRAELTFEDASETQTILHDLCNLLISKKN